MVVGNGNTPRRSHGGMRMNSKLVIALVVQLGLLTSPHAFSAEFKLKPEQSSYQVEVQTSKKKEFEKLLAAAKAGDTQAEHYVGECFDYGWVVKINAGEAIQWYERAAGKGHVQAQVALGILYSGTGLGQEFGYRWVSPLSYCLG